MSGIVRFADLERVVVGLRAYVDAAIDTLERRVAAERERASDGIMAHVTGLREDHDAAVARRWARAVSVPVIETDPAVLDRGWRARIEAASLGHDTSIAALWRAVRGLSGDGDAAGSSGSSGTR